MNFHYLRVGKASQLLDNLKEVTKEKEIEWVHHEVNSFREYHFGKNYEKYDGSIVNLAITDENLAQIRRDFWENFVWTTQDIAHVTAIVIPDSNKYGSLTRSQVIEGLSLIRLTDRPFEIFENKEGIEKEVAEWLTKMTVTIHQKKPVTEETDDK